MVVAGESCTTLCGCTAVEAGRNLEEAMIDCYVGTLPIHKRRTDCLAMTKQRRDASASTLSLRTSKNKK